MGSHQGLRGAAQGTRSQPTKDIPTSPMRYLRLPHGILGSCCWKAFVRYVFRISMQTLKEEGQAWLYSTPQSHSRADPLLKCG